MVAAHQSLSRHVGPERLPAELPEVRRLRDTAGMPAHRCHRGIEAEGAATARLMTPDLSIRLNRAAGRMLRTLLLVTLAAAVVAE